MPRSAIGAREARAALLFSHWGKGRSLGQHRSKAVSYTHLDVYKRQVDEVREYFGRLVFATPIPRTVKLSEAPSFGQPITQYDPKGRGALSYIELAKEVIARG